MDELALLVASQVDVAVTHLDIILELHQLDLDEVVVAGVLEVLKVLEIGVSHLGAIVLGRLGLDLKLAIRVQSPVLNLDSELVLVLIFFVVVALDSVPVLQIVQVNVDDSDIDVLLLEDLDVLELMEVIICNLLVEKE